MSSETATKLGYLIPDRVVDMSIRSNDPSGSSTNIAMTGGPNPRQYSLPSLTEFEPLVQYPLESHVLPFVTPSSSFPPDAQPPGPGLGNIFRVFDYDQNNHNVVTSQASSSSYYPASSMARSESMRRSLSSTTPTTLPRDNRSRPRAALSFKEELQEVKDDLGIPPTRDASRESSPCTQRGYQAGTPFSGQAFAHDEQFQRVLEEGHEPSTGSTVFVPGPDIPGLLSAQEVAILFAR